MLFGSKTLFTQRQLLTALEGHVTPKSSVTSRRTYVQKLGLWTMEMWIGHLLVTASSFSFSAHVCALVVKLFINDEILLSSCYLLPTAFVLSEQ